MTLWRRLLQQLVQPAQLVDVLEPDHRQEPVSVRPELRRLAAEALILSDEADAVIRLIRARTPLGFVAPRAGPLVRRFFGLQDKLPVAVDQRELQLRQRLSSILEHHALLLSMAMDLLAYEWRSPRLSVQIDALDGIGAPALWLEEIYAELVAETPDGVAEIRRTISE